ncbi:YtoQ family protein [Nitratireductor sp. GCM10026969]|uniref:YtoQ family protein n=1 Tax=Nitratireductor sp. GCM10026969 TaxID=3252645 RepID=UPI00360BDBAA
MQLKVYLAGEIHTDWRGTIVESCKGLDITWLGPVTDHGASDDCGVEIFGAEDKKFWHDRKGALLNAVRIRTGIEQADVLVVCFGEKYKQWNAAFDAGYAAALHKPIIVLHPPEFDHALKEVDAAANAVARTPEEVARALRYVITGKL